MIDFAALIELELDFGEEDVEFAKRVELLALLDRLVDLCTELIDSFRYGNAIRQGVPIAILGAPNSGKSTLLNTLLMVARAIGPTTEVGVVSSSIGSSVGASDIGSPGRSGCEQPTDHDICHIRWL